MSRHDVVIIKETHRGLLYEDGFLKDVLPAGRYQVPRPPSRFASLIGFKRPLVEIAVVDVRQRDRLVILQDFLTAEGATISATFNVRYHVADPKAAIHEVKNFEERLCTDTQTAARRILRGLSLDEILAGRDEIGEEMVLQARELGGHYGVEIADVDLKDLVVPEDYRKAKNLAAAANRLREVQAGAFDPQLSEEGAEEEAGVLVASGSFAGGSDDEPSEFILSRSMMRRGREPRARKARMNGFEAPARRYRP